MEPLRLRRLWARRGLLPETRVLGRRARPRRSASSPHPQADTRAACPRAVRRSSNTAAGCDRRRLLATRRTLARYSGRPRRIRSSAPPLPRRPIDLPIAPRAAAMSKRARRAPRFASERISEQVSKAAQPLWPLATVGHSLTKCTRRWSRTRVLWSSPTQSSPGSSRWAAHSGRATVAVPTL